MENQPPAGVAPYLPALPYAPQLEALGLAVPIRYIALSMSLGNMQCSTASFLLILWDSALVRSISLLAEEASECQGLHADGSTSLCASAGF